MKKILVSLIAVSTAFCLPSVANAQATPNSATSTLTGNVTPTCTVTATDGVLATGALVTSIETASAADAGTFNTICNTSSSTIKVELVAPVSADAPTGSTQVLLREYKLSGGTGTYAPSAPTDIASAATFSATPFNSPTGAGIHNNYSTTSSSMKVWGKVSVDPAGSSNGQNLMAGAYKVKAIATVTP
jgi:hypothetical protein